MPKRTRKFVQHLHMIGRDVHILFEKHEHFDESEHLCQNSFTNNLHQKLHEWGPVLLLCIF